MFFFTHTPNNDDLKNIIKKIIKYIIMFFVVCFAVIFISKSSISKFKCILISLIACTSFVIIDQISPSIHVTLTSN